MEQNLLQRPKNRSQFVDTVQVIYFKTMRASGRREKILIFWENNHNAIAGIAVIIWGV